MFALKLFGGATLEGSEGPLAGPPAQRHRLALLALLSGARGGTLSRDRLLGYLWPESDTERARRLLNVSVHTLRRALGDDALVSAGDDLRLNPAVVRSDVAEFSAALEEGERERAVALYAGPFLDGFFLAGAAEFSRWAEAERDRLARVHQDALEALAEGAEARGEVRTAAGWWRRLAAEAPHSARVALRVMEALDAAGDRAGALQHARVYDTLYREEFEAEPDPEVAALAERLRTAPPRRAAPPPPAPPERPPVEPVDAALPAEATPAPEAPGPPGIAVLPLVDDSEGHTNEYFTDGLTEEIISALSRVAGLRVVARTSAFAFKGRRVETPEIGRRLGARYLLEGSVRKGGESLRIHIRLVEAATGYLLWSAKHDRRMGDIFLVQDEIARAVVDALEVELVEGKRVAPAGRATRDLEAYNLYLQGRHAWYMRHPAEFEVAIGYFQRAVERDPDYALAYIGLADVYNMLGASEYGVLPPREIFPRARDAATRALALDPELAEGHAALAHVLFSYEWDWEGAERAFRRALQLNPGYAVAHHWYSLYLVAVGRRGEALSAIQRARELDPVSRVMSTGLARHYYYLRQYDRSIREYRRTLEVEPDFLTALLGLGLSYTQAGAPEEALAALRRAERVAGPQPVVLALLGHALARSGREDEARELLRRLEREAGERYVPPDYPALVALGLGEVDEAFRRLEEAYENRSGALVYLEVEPLLDPLRPDPRFARLRERVGLPASSAG